MNGFERAPEPTPLAADRTGMVRWLIYLLLAGGSFAVGALVLLPLPANVNRTGSLLSGLAAMALAAVLAAGRRRIPPSAMPVGAVIGTAIVSVAIYSWGPSPSDDAVFYVWVMLYAACFFSARQTALQLGVIGIAYAAVLVAQGAGREASTRWAATMITLAVAATVISRLVGALRVAVRRQAREASEREDLLVRMEEAALTDELTGLPNRRAWEEQFAREINRARRSGSDVCVALLDLDHFKAYNDTHGHRAGDLLLAEAARAWSSKLRGGDVLARYGGEEFAIVLPGCDADAGLALVERLRAATPPARTVSAGVAVWDGVEGAIDLVDRADRALYDAKAAGRDRAVLAAPPEPRRLTA